MAAGLGFKSFSTGDVLSAADTNGYLMQGIWVFANAAARTAAVTSPQEGNYSFLKDTNSTEYYDGSAWVAAGGGGGGGGLTKITPTSIANSGGTASTTGGVTTASAVNSLSINGVFSSTYVNYIIEYNELSTSGNDQIMNMRLRASGTDNTSAIYKLASIRVSYSGGGGAGYSGGVETSWTFIINSDEIKTGSPIFVNSPNVAVETSYSSVYSSGENAGYIAGFHNSASAFDGFTVYPSGGTFSGIFRVYGISN